MSYSPGKDRNIIASLKRAPQQAWFGEGQPVEEFAIAPIFANGEALPTLSSDGKNPVPTLSLSSGGIGYLPIGTPVAYRCLSNAELGNTRFFISDSYYRVASIRFVYATAGTSSSIAIQVTKDTVGNSSAQAPGTGVPLLATAFDGVNTVVDTVTTGVMITAGSPGLFLAPGDSLSVLFTGTLTTIAGVVVEVDLVNTCSAYLGGQPTYQPPLQTPVGTTQVSNVAQYYVRSNGEVASQAFFLANRDMNIVAIYATVNTAFAAAVTIDITKDTGTQAPGAGSSVLAAAMDGTASGKLLVPGLNLTANRLLVQAGNRLSVKYSATTTGAGVCITVVFAPLYDRLEISIPLGNATADKLAQYWFIANRFYELVDLSCVFPAAAGSASNVAVTIDSVLNAPGSGLVVQTDNTNAGFDANATANTVQVATLATLRNRLLSQGGRLGFVKTGAALPNGLLMTASLRART